MPWTFAHPAAVLPLRAFHRLPFGALVVGSMSPDIGYYFGAFDVATRAHTLPGLIIICLPTAIALMIILRVLHKPVAGLLPYPHRQAALALPPFLWPTTLPAAGFLCLAIVIGATTHVVWDAFTHRAGFFVANIPALRAISFNVHGRDILRFEVIQHLSTVVGVIILIVAYQRVSRDAALVSVGPRESDAWRYGLLGIIAVMSMAAAVPIAYFTAAQGSGMSGTLLVVRFVIACTTVFAVLLAAAGLVDARRRKASVEGKG
jgi:spore maturation protein SpmB